MIERGSGTRRIPAKSFPIMRTRSPVVALLSGAVLAIGLLQIVRAAVTGGGALLWIMGVAFIVAGGGRLYIWFRD